MRTKHLFYAAVLPLALAACSEDQYLENAANVGQDKLGTLINAPIMGGNVADYTESRVFDFEDHQWYWIPETDGRAITKVDYLGLCWTGVVNGEEYQGPATTTGDMVYTNYKFAHVGWLKDGETAPKLHCGELNNGAYHAFNTALTPQATYNAAMEEQWYKDTEGDLNMQTGVFKSEHSTIYAGEYIVYSPYNDGFWNEPVTAVQDRTMTLTVNEDGKVVNPTELMSKYAFNVGYMSSIKGGDEACQFSTKLLSSGWRLNFTGAKEIKEIVLWSKGSKFFLTKQALSAKAIKEGKNGSDLFIAGKSEAVSNIITKMSKNLKSVADATQSLYIPFLPANDEAADLRILLVDAEGKTAVISKNVDFQYGQPKATSLIFDGNEVKQVLSDQLTKVGEFKDLNYAYDNDSFWAAYEKAVDNVTLTNEDARTVSMLGDITLEENRSDLYTAMKNVANKVTVEPAEDETAALTLAQLENETDSYEFANTIFGVDVTTNPKGCCESSVVNVLFEAVTTEAGTVTTVNGGEISIAGKTTLNGDLLSVYEPKDEEGNYHSENMPKITLLNGADVKAYAAVRNEGKLLIPCGAENSKLTLVGAELTNVAQNYDGENLQAVIEVQGNGNSGQDGVLNLENDDDDVTVLKNEGLIQNKGNIFNNHSTFTNEANATFVDYVGSTLSGNRIVNKDVTSEFISEVNSIVRYNNAIDLEGIRPTTTVRFVYGDDVNIGSGTFTTEYTLQPNKEDGIYVPYPAGGEDRLIKFESKIAENETLKLNNAVDANDQVIATKIGDVTIYSGNAQMAHGDLTVDGDYTAKDQADDIWTSEGVKLAVTGDVNLTKLEWNFTISANSEVTVGGKMNITAVHAVYVRTGATLNVTGDINIENVSDEVRFCNSSRASAANMTVSANNDVVFEKNQVTKLGSKGVNGMLTNNGSIEIVNSVSGSDVAAKVWCNNIQGTGSYTNNSYPQYYE